MEPPRIEAEIRRQLGAGRADEAVTLALRSYGPELFGFLAATERDEAVASDAFSLCCEDLWRGIATWRGEASFRTWAYTLARNAAHRVRRDPHLRRRVALSTGSMAERLAAELRESTLTHLRSEVRDKVKALRERLDPEDQAMLVLRVDRGMTWVDVARVLEGDAATDEAVRRRAAALRKRFERVKDELRRLARAEGLLGGRSGRSA